MGFPKFLYASLHACHSFNELRQPFTPSPFAGDLVLPSVGVKTLGDWNAISELYQLSGSAISPTACRILCVRFVCFVRGNSTRSATDATLDTGGWLNLTRQGLSPCKMHQASLGALTRHSAACPLQFFVKY